MQDDGDSARLDISPLPTELLCRIFLLVRWAYETDPSLIPHSNGYLQWIPACSHVSQHWRRIALNYPVLWTNPPIHQPQLTDVMLQRSDAAPLSFALDLRLTHPTRAISIITQWAPQIRSLEIWCVWLRRDFTKFLHVLPDNFTTLEELFINHGRRPCWDVRYNFRDSHRQNVHISEEQLFPLPALRTIILNHVNISWNSRIFGETVTTLSISNVSKSARFNAKELRSMLGHMPNLIYLCTSNACRDGEKSPNGRRGVQLAKLKTISMGSSSDEIGLVFDNIETSSTLASVVLLFDNSRYRNPASIDFELHRVLSTFSHPCWLRGIGQGTGIVSISQGAIGGGIYDLTLSLLSHPIQDPTKFSFGISIQPGPYDSEQTLEKNMYITEVLFRQLHCSNLHALSLSENLDIPSDTLATTFGTLHHLVVVYVHGPCAHSLIEALHRGYSEASIFLIPDPVPFPALQYLRVTNHTFGDWLDRSPMSLDDLRMCVKRRAAWDVAIQKLKLETCCHKVPGELFERRELFPEEVASLGDLVGEIVWD